MHHRLFVAGLIVPEVRVLLEGLADPGYDAVAEDPEAPCKETLFDPVAFYVLCLEERDRRLSYRHSFRCHVRSRPVIQ